MMIFKKGLSSFSSLHVRNPVKITALSFMALMLLSCPTAATAGPASSASDYNRTVHGYDIPDLEIVRHDGKKVKLAETLNDGRPVLLNFVFASCSAICPMLSHTFMQIQNKLGKDKQDFHLVSVSIDPENDTPAVLRNYAKKFKAGANWDFYTGTLETIATVQKAFNVFRGDKMNHPSVILIRSAPNGGWLRLEGFAGPDDAVRELNSLVKSDKPRKRLKN